MAKLSNSTLERLAVLAIENEATKPSSYLRTNIPVGDKGISFDGQIDVFINDSEKTESFVGIVPVQVKGTQVKEFSQEKRSFTLNINHYRNYYKTGGALLLVVEIKENRDTKIFYKQLLPLELSNIIKQFGVFKKQKSRSVDLRPLEETSLYNVCRKFIHEGEIQPKTLVENRPLLETKYSTYTLSSLTFNPGRQATSNIFDHDFTVYGVINNLKIPLHQARITEWRHTFQEYIDVNGNEELFNINVSRTEDGITLIFEEVFKFTFNGKTNKINMNFMEFHSLAAQLKVIPLVIQLFTNKKLDELGININNLHDTPEEISKIIEEMQITHACYKDTQKVFEILGIDENTVIRTNNPDQDLFMELQHLTRAILHNNLSGVKIDNPEYGSLVRFEVGDLICILSYYPAGVQKLTNAFSEEMLKLQYVLHSEGEVPTPHSIYTVLTVEALAKAANIDLSIIRASFDQIDSFLNDFALTVTNNFCLKCINAYDQSKNTVLLDTAEYIYNKYKAPDSSTSPTLNDAIIAINLCQIRKRKYGQLSSEDFETLFALKANFIREENVELLFCINVLLESKVEANMAFRKIKSEQQKFYEELPIANLYRELL